MSTALATPPRMRFFTAGSSTSAALPLAFGKVYFYAAGTTTPKDTYSDAAGLVRNQNPVILNSRGEPPVTIRLGSGGYKVVITNSLGVQQGDPIDNYFGSEPFGASAVILSQLATGAGAGSVGSLQEGVGAVLRTVQDELDDIGLNVKSFGAVGNGVADDTAAIQLALNRADVLGGCRVFLPRGTYKCNGPLNIYKRTQLYGQGRTTSVLAFTHAGDGIKSTWPVNASTAVWIGLRDFGMTNSSGANTGGGFVDVGGTFVDLHNVYITGFRYQVILDQSEIVTIKECEFIHGAGKTAIWIVNGDDHSALASRNYTNRITIAENQFNGENGGLENILDDGGVNHTIRDNNFNGGTMALRAAGVFGISFAGNESETHTGTAAMVWTNTTKAGAYVGGCMGVDFTAGNTFYEASSGVFPVLIDDIQGGVIKGNSFATGGAQVFLLTNGPANPTTGLVIEANSKTVCGNARTPARWIDTASLVALRNVQFRQTPATFVPDALSGTGMQTIIPQHMDGIRIGSRLVCMNQDGTNAETVVVTDAQSSSFAATFASAKNSANWCIYGSTPANEEEGVWTPLLAGSTTAGTHTATSSAGKWSRRGNMVRLTGQILITAKDAAMAGNLLITGLPFTSNHVGNQIGTCAVVFFSGFTLPAGYTMIGGAVAAAAATVGLVRSGSGVGVSQLTAGDIAGTACSLGFVIDMETQNG